MCDWQDDIVITPGSLQALPLVCVYNVMIAIAMEWYIEPKGIQCNELFHSNYGMWCHHLEFFSKICLQSSFTTRNARLHFEEAEASVKDDKVKHFEPRLGFPQLHLVLWNFICCRDAAEWFLKCSVILKNTYHKRNCWDSLKTILVIHLSTQFSTTNIWFKVKFSGWGMHPL